MIYFGVSSVPQALALEKFTIKTSSVSGGQYLRRKLEGGGNWAACGPGGEQAGNEDAAAREVQHCDELTVSLDSWASSHGEQLVSSYGMLFSLLGWKVNPSSGQPASPSPPTNDKRAFNTYHVVNQYVLVLDELNSVFVVRSPLQKQPLSTKVFLKLTSQSFAWGFPLIVYYYSNRIITLGNATYQVTLVECNMENYSWNHLVHYPSCLGENLRNWRFRLYVLPLRAFLPFIIHIKKSTMF